MKTPKNFEDGLERLKAILTQLQAADTPLDKSVKLYADAAELIAYCDATLRGAKLQIEEIDAALEKAKAGTEDAQ